MVWTLQGVATAKRTRTTIQIAPNEHVDDPLGVYFNHSFNPNCRIEGRVVIALRDIEVGEHLVFDYTTNEDSIAPIPLRVTRGVLKRLHTPTKHK
jgi:hypothetical protein